MFLEFIDDMPKVTTSEARLFADDGLLYREIRTKADSDELQRDLDALGEWETRWQIHFNPEKCQVLHMCTNKRFRTKHSYNLHGHIFEDVDSAKYLGVTLTKYLSWKQHVDNTAAKASKTLGFLRRYLYNCTKKARERTYHSLVVPSLNYAAAAWDPHQARDI